MTQGGCVIEILVGFMEPVAFFSGISGHSGVIVHPGVGPGTAWSRGQGTFYDSGEEQFSV